MSITFDPKKQSFILETRETSYQMMVDEKGYLLHLHYGAKVDGLSDHLLTFKDHGFSVNPYSAGEDRTYTLDALPQEFPFQGSASVSCSSARSSAGRRHRSRSSSICSCSARTAALRCFTCSSRFMRPRTI